MPWLDATKLLPPDPAAYLVPFGALVVPTILVLSAIFFAVGALTRNAFAIHAQGIVLFVAWLIAQTADRRPQQPDPRGTARPDRHSRHS